MSTENDFAKIIRECTALYDEMFPGENMMDADDGALSDFDPYHTINYAMMALNYYQAGRTQNPYTTKWVQPDYVPETVYVECDVMSDLPSDRVSRGLHYVARYNRWGAISVVGSSGKLIGLRPHEFRVISWQERKPEE